eukprot:CAMPEP_0175761644 /NCGR_PEP_ID=MMETSP0097-20121207/66774_1 /TAXON_ID=311494 /ORGANISM="Alexandrium monilatum, Strain CCMP3105" /LENGTH=54 /DNA_ID=CAMNT_0017071241 /DNA_START=24 /DNA_END=184 /DNA_ORIENTATION=-
MSQVTLAFHQSLQLPPAAKGLGGSISLEPSWTVRQLASAIERHCASSGVAVRVA